MENKEKEVRCWYCNEMMSAYQLEYGCVYMCDKCEDDWYKKHQ